jgi:fructose-1,6-bisphosphatase/inositol monophosphatase family enzyme
MRAATGFLQYRAGELAANRIIHLMGTLAVDGYWERHINSWDAAAGLVLVREAGGWTNDFLAGGGLTQGSEILAATPELVEPLKRLTAFGWAA